MALISPYEGEVLMLNYILGKETPPVGGPYLRLYTSPIGELSRDLVISNITEVDDGGTPLYSAVAMDPAQWTVANISSVTVATYPEVTFQFDQSQDVYGYYVTDDDPATTILWIEKFPDGPFSIPSAGTEIKITPVIVLI